MRNETELIFILDKSNSMSSLTSETIDGFNEVIEQSRSVAKEENVFVTTALFSDRVTFLYKKQNIFDVKPLTKNEYFVDGRTALYDAVGETIDYLDKARKSQKDGVATKTILFIATDGKENCSRKYRCQEIRKLIVDKSAKGWTFVYLATGIDLKEAQQIGIDEKFSAAFARNRDGIRSMFGKMLSMSRAAICNDLVGKDKKETSTT